MASLYSRPFPRCPPRSLVTVTQVTGSDDAQWATRHRQRFAHKKYGDARGIENINKSRAFPGLQPRVYNNSPVKFSRSMARPSIFCFLGRRLGIEKKKILSNQATFINRSAFFVTISTACNDRGDSFSYYTGKGSGYYPLDSRVQDRVTWKLLVQLCYTVCNVYS